MGKKLSEFKVGDVVKIYGDGLKPWGVPSGTRGVVVPSSQQVMDEDTVEDTIVNVLWDVGDEDRVWYAEESELVFVDRPFVGSPALDTPHSEVCSTQGPLSTEVKRPLELTSDQLADGCYSNADELVIWLESIGFDVNVVEKELGFT